MQKNIISWQANHIAGFWRALGLIAIDANSICAYGPHFVLGSDDQ